MVTAKQVINSTKPKITKVPTGPTQKGSAGYDNIRDDIEKTKSLRECSTTKLTINTDADTNIRSAGTFTDVITKYPVLTALAKGITAVEGGMVFDHELILKDTSDVNDGAISVVSKTSPYPRGRIEWSTTDNRLVISSTTGHIYITPKLNVAGKTQVVYPGTTPVAGALEGASTNLPMLHVSSNPTGTDGSQITLNLQRNTNATNAIVSGAILHARSTGTAAAGFGTRFRFDITGSDDVVRAIGGFGGFLETSTSTGGIMFQTMNAGSLTTKMKIKGDGETIIYGAKPNLRLWGTANNQANAGSIIFEEGLAGPGGNDFFTIRYDGSDNKLKIHTLDVNNALTIARATGDVDILNDFTAGTITSDAGVTAGTRLVSGTLTVTASADNTDVSGINTLFINPGAAVVIGGFAGGVDGQVLHVIVVDADQNVTMEHQEAEGTQKLIMHQSLDETLNSEYGGWTFVFNSTTGFWHDCSHARHV